MRILMNIWMVKKNSIKHHHYLKKKIFVVVMEDITDADYADAKRVCQDLIIKNLGEYHNLYALFFC